MTKEDIQAAIESALSPEFVLVESADNVHFYITVVSSLFEGMMKIKQHRMVKE